MPRSRSATSSRPSQARAVPRLVICIQTIELAFKRLKSLLQIDRLPTWTERGSRSWLYAHLILALLCDDLSQDFLDSSPEDLLDAAYVPSLWAVQKTVLMVLLGIVIGPLSV